MLNHHDGRVDKALPVGADAARADEREAEVWVSLWGMPQAVAWEQLGWTHDVALYARWLVMAEAGDMKAASEARQWSDRLGLNPAAMLRNRWKVAVDEVAVRRDDRDQAPPHASSARDRLKAVPRGTDAS